MLCAVKRRCSTASENLARELFAPPGSNRSGGGGNEAAGASGVEGIAIGDSVRRRRHKAVRMTLLIVVGEGRLGPTEITFWL
jgi:hypothetical protein